MAAGWKGTGVEKMMFNNDTHERADELNKIIVRLRQKVKREQSIIIRGMTPEEFEEYANKFTKGILAFKKSRWNNMAIIGGELGPTFAEAVESFLEAKREFENEIRESWIIVLDYFIPESWARYIVSKIPSRVVWWTVSGQI